MKAMLEARIAETRTKTREFSGQNVARAALEISLMALVFPFVSRQIQCSVSMR
jgi:hypothetical protein